jgi:putative nucleotidyltransferase with HDIG domain
MATFNDLYQSIQKYHSKIFKYALFVFSVLVVLWMFPAGVDFKYEYSKGRPWQYENLYAPFDFDIQKSIAEVEQEQNTINNNQTHYFIFDEATVNEVEGEFYTLFRATFGFNFEQDSTLLDLYTIGNEVIDELYSFGVFERTNVYKRIEISKENRLYTLNEGERIFPETLRNKIEELIPSQVEEDQKAILTQLLSQTIQPNLTYDEELSAAVLNEQLGQISYTLGEILEGTLIVSRGKIIEQSEFQLLESLRSEYQSQLISGLSFYIILTGYGLLVALVLLMLMLFIKKYRPSIYEDNNQLTFIFLNILLFVFVVITLVQIDESYSYMAPLCILPLILKNFFDARLGLFGHVIALLIIGFVVPNSFEFVFVQVTAGIVTILGAQELHKRSNLFLTVGQITLVYIFTYVAFTCVHDGSIASIDLRILLLFLINGMVTLFAQPLIYLYERIFGMVSDISLLELSDTNSSLLKVLSNEAPGTFNHSLQVANLAEAAANEIDANALLVRVGALYHDIGKLDDPIYYSENQIHASNPHDELNPFESAHLIKSHVIKGIEIAQKYNIPDRVIDFIRTHHGNSLIYYFYKKQQEVEPEVEEFHFRYNGPIPFSKETAILMMCDAVEAATKSLKEPGYNEIDDFVERIINTQMGDKQFLNANISFKEIEDVKKVLKKKLNNIYHVRVEYPE